MPAKFAKQANHLERKEEKLSAQNYFLIFLVLIPLEFAWMSWLLPAKAFTPVAFILLIQTIFVFYKMYKHNNLRKLAKNLKTNITFFALLSFFVPMVFQARNYITLGDLSWDSHNYHIPLVHMIWQFRGYNDWPLLILWQYNPSLFELQASFLAGITRSTSAIGFLGGFYLILIFVQINRSLRSLGANPTSALVIGTISVVSASTLFFNAFTAYCDIAHAFFWLVFLEASMQIIQGRQGKNNQIQMVLGFMGIVSTKYSALLLAPTIMALCLVLILKKRNSIGSIKWFSPLILVFFWPIRSFIETNQPIFPLKLPFFDGWGYITLSQGDDALDASRGTAAEATQSVFQYSFHNWFGSIYGFLKNAFTFLWNGDVATLEKYFGYDPRPLGVGPLFHILFASVILINLYLISKRRLSKTKTIQVLGCLLLLVFTMFYSHHSVYLRYNFGIVLFIFSTLLYFLFSHFQWETRKLFKFCLYTLLTLATAINVSAATNYAEKNGQRPKNENIEHFYAHQSGLDFPQCYKFYSSGFLPFFASSAWSTNMCGGFTARIEEANFVITNIEPVNIEGWKNTSCPKGTAYFDLNSFFSYPSRFYDAKQCREYVIKSNEKSSSNNSIE